VSQQLINIPASSVWQAFWRNESDALCLTREGHAVATLPRAGGLLCGSFNPLHHGHRELAAAAAQMLAAPTCFELSVANVDKPELDESEVLRRAAQFYHYADLIITRAATFKAKAALLLLCR
jgi:hypothetical protein